MSAGTSLTPADGNPLSSILVDDPPRPLEPYPPVEADLDSLASILTKTNRLQILEYGVGWSTDVFAEHISIMTAKSFFRRFALQQLLLLICLLLLPSHALAQVAGNYC